MSGLPRVGFVAGTLGLGGAERQLFEQCRILVEAGVAPVVLSLTRSETWEGPLADLGVSAVWVGRSAHRPARLREVVAAFRRTPVDFIQASHSMTNLYAAAAGRLLRRPSVGALRTSPDRILSSFGGFGSATLRAPDRLAGNSRTNLEAAVRLGVPRAKVRYLPNLVDLDRFAAPASPSARDVDVLFVGRLGPEKRVDVLIDALALLISSGREVHGVIVGAGPLDGELRRRASSAGLDDLHARFAGADTCPERWYRSARVLVLPSEHEGMPNVVLEAMASGLPVVATAVGSVPELIEDGRTGILVPVGDAPALATAVGRLLDAPAWAAELAAAARHRVTQGFDRDALTTSMQDLYSRLATRWRACAG